MSVVTSFRYGLSFSFVMNMIGCASRYDVIFAILYSKIWLPPNLDYWFGGLNPKLDGGVIFRYGQASLFLLVQMGEGLYARIGENRRKNRQIQTTTHVESVWKNVRNAILFVRFYMKYVYS